MDKIKETIIVMIKALFKPDNKLSLIPNWLSFTRAITGPIIPVIVYSGAGIEIVFTTLLFVTLSDFLDGKIARKVVKKETHEGAMLDAISDKIFSISLMIGLIPIIPTMTCNLALEGATSVINGKILAKGKTPKSSFIGKIKTWPLFISLALAYTGLSVNGNIPNINQSDLIFLASTFSIGTIPLEVITTKKYLSEYLETNQNDENEIIEIKNAEIIDEKDEIKDTKKISYTLEREKNNMVMVFENEEKTKENSKGKQKRIEL